MQKNYSQEKFRELSEDRQVHVFLQLLESIEAIWDNSDKRKVLLDRLKAYFIWFEFGSRNNSFLRNLAHLQGNISEKMSLRQLLDLTVPLERYLNLSLRDEQIVKIKNRDQLNRMQKTFPVRFVLDHLRSAFNVGSLFRTAECLGVEHIHLVGYTPSPEDLSVQKTAMGTEKFVSWSSHSHIESLISELKREGFQLVAMETVEDAVPLQNFVADKPLALFVGNERFGLEPALLQKMDLQIIIPMMGVKNSLNVANSLSIAAFEVIRQIHFRDSR